MADITALVAEFQNDPVGMGYIVIKGGHSAAHRLYMDDTTRQGRHPVRPDVVLTHLADAGLLDALASSTGSTEVVKSASLYFYSISIGSVDIDMDDSELISMRAVLVSDNVWTQDESDALDGLGGALISRGEELVNVARVKDVRQAFEIIGV